MISFLKYHLPVILYGALVLGVSSIPNLRTPEVRYLASDKIAHFLEYAFFALLAFRSTSHLLRSQSRFLPFLAALLWLAGFAVVDEVLQSFIPGRHSDWLDYVFDLAGAVAVLLLLFWNRQRGARKSTSAAVDK